MINFKKHENPVVSAENIINSIDLIEFPIDVEKIAKETGIQEINETNTDQFEGMLVTLPDKSAGFINISSNIRESARKRFTIAHELGHFVISTHNTKYSCSINDLNNYYDEKHPHEIEANQFATELLMPERYFRADIITKDPSCQLIRKLIKKYQSSLTSTLIRFKDLTNENIVVALSENSIVKWARRSTECRYFVESKVELSPETFAFEFFEGNDLPVEFEEVEVDAWFANFDVTHKISVKELSIPLPFYNQVISLIWIIEDEEEIEEDDEDEFDGYLKLKEKW